ncbi:MAG: hypothetical protein RIS82_732 [Actinomycetota bacterium]
MFGTKSGLRKFVAIISVTTTLAILAPTAAVAAPPYQSTVSWLNGKFVSGKYLPGFTAGSKDIGMSIEALLQLSAGGYDLGKLTTKARYLLNTKSVVGDVSTRNGYVFNTDATKTVHPAAAGKYLFVAQALEVPTESLKYQVFLELKKQIRTDGTVVGALSDFDYAWVALGLNAYLEHTLANKVIQKLISRQNTDGGFTSYGEASSIDGTGLALQALSLRRWFGTSAEDKKRSVAIGKALSYLRKNDTTDNHFEYTDGSGFDLNGTAYAAMGLKAAGKLEEAKEYRIWLRSKLVATGGFKTPWSGGAADLMATSQAYVPLIAKSYLDLLTD